MVQQFTGGEVGINVSPDTRGFRRELERFLHSLDDDFQIRIRPDMSAYDRAKRSINGDDLVSTVDFRTNADAVVREMKALRAESDMTGRNMPLSGSLAEAQRNLKKTIEQSKTLKQVLADNKDFGKPFARLNDEQAVLSKYQDSLKRVSAAQKAELARMRDDLRRFMETANRFDPLGNAKQSKLGQQVQDYLKAVDMMIDELDRNPGAELSIRWKEQDYIKFRAQYESVFRDIEELNNQNARVKVFVDGADRLQAQLDRMRRSMATIPDGLRTSVENAISKLRDAERRVRADPNARFTLDVRADVDEANRELKDLKDKHDKLAMDLDIQTAGARAHLAEFTRPRTVDIFARFHGSDFGRIIDGIAKKGTGLATVQNQFSKLVNTFDKLDKVVPKYATVASVFGAISAGATNLASSALGVGAALARMGQAALAAPAAFAGLAAAGYAGKQVFNDMKSRSESLRSSLDDLNATIGNNAWAQYGDTFRNLATSLFPTLKAGLGGIATEEGRVVDGLLKVANRSAAMGELSGIFDNTRFAVANLNPGLQSLVGGFLSLGDATSRYLPRAATYISQMSNRFADWVEAAKQSGSIDQAMRNAAEQAGYLKSSVGSLMGVVKGLHSGLAESENGLQGFSETLANVDKAVSSVKFQSVLHELRDGAQEAQRSFRGVLGGFGNTLYDLRDEARDVFADMGANVANGVTMISRVLDGSQAGIRDFSSGIRQGFAQLSDAVGDNSGMFNQLLSTAGTLADTMGGTLANALRVNAPLITALARAAQTVSEAFGALPAPIQQVIALWATFGRMGKGAINSLKEGMMSSIMQTLQYRKAMNELGVEVGSTSNRMGTLVRAFTESKGWDTGVLDRFGIGLEKVNTSGGKTTGVLGKLKGVASGALGLLGGPWGAAAIAAFTGVSAAVSDYTAKSQATEAVTRNIANAMDNVSISATKAGTAVSNINKEMVSAFSDQDYGETGLNWLSDFTYGSQTASDAAKKLGYSTGDLAKIVQNGGSAYEDLQKHLESVSDADTEYYANANGGILMMGNQAKASGKLSESLKKLQEDSRNNIKTMAESNDHGEKYVNTLMSLGNATDFMALKAKSASEQQADLVKAQQLGQQIVEDETNARIRAAQAAASYESVYSQMGGTIQQVNALASQGQQVWNQQAGAFDYTTEAGRTASNAITTLASSANEYLNAMIANGASTDEVNAKQKELAGNLGDTANQLTNGAAGAASYADSLLMTPKDIKTKVELQSEQAKTSLMQYVSLLEATFPNSKGGQATFNTVMNMTASGAITSMDQVMAKKKELLQGLKDGTMVITVDADGTKAVMTLDDVKALGGQIQKDGSYKVGISADDQASPHLHEIISLLQSSGIDGKQITMFMNAEGNAQFSLDQVRGALSALGMSNKDIEIFMNANGNAPEQTELVRQKLAELGMSPKQIDWFLNAIDQTLAGTSSAQQNIDDVKQKSPASVGAKDDTKKDTDSAQRNIDSVKQKNKSSVGAKDDTKGPTDSAKRNIDSVKGKNVKVGATTSGLGGVQGLVRAIGGLQSKTVTITTVMRSYMQSFGGSSNYAPGVSLPHKAAGGRIHGPGTGTSDSIHAKLSNGEMVLRAMSVRKLDAKYGPGFLDKLNVLGDVERAMRPSPVALKYRAHSRALANGGRVNGINMTPIVQVNPVVNAGNAGIDPSAMQSAVASGVSAALSQSQMRLAFDARGAARVMAEPMSREIGLLERTGRTR